MFCPWETQIYIADFLSRNFIKRSEIDDPTLKEVVHVVSINDINFSVGKFKEYQDATAKDKTLSEILNFYKNGWPKNFMKQTGEIKHFLKIRENIHVREDLVYFENRLVVPLLLRKNILQSLHETHLGISKTKNLARQHFYWPGMSSDIENFIQSCYTCLRFSNNNVKEPLK